MSTRARTVAGFGLAVDLAMLGVSAATAVTLARAFRDWSELPRLLLVVLIAHIAARLTRVARLGALVATGVLLVGGAVVLTLLWYRHISPWGLPTPAVGRAAAADARAAFGPFRSLVAPIDAVPGFTLVFAAGLWLLATFSDLATSRADTPVQAIAPQAATFVFSSIVLLGRHATLATGAFVGAVLFYALTIRAARLERRLGRSRVSNGEPPGDVPGDARTGAPDRAASATPARRVRGPAWAVAVPVGALAVGAGLALGSVAPTGEHGLVDLRAIGRGGGPLRIDSPMVSLTALLGDESDQELFRVTTTTPHYWRQTALDEFDGAQMTATAQSREIDSSTRLDSVLDPADDTRPRAAGAEDVREQIGVSLVGLQTTWLPTVPVTRSVDASVDLRYIDDTASVLADTDEPADGLSYRVTADVRQFTPDELRAAPHVHRSTMPDQFTVPTNLPAILTSTARGLATGLNPYDAALALQNYFRSDAFTYDRLADYRNASDPWSAFLIRRRGFCQQFAVTFAAMARTVGLPTRVAVGFTPGDLDPPGPSGAPTGRTIRGRNAHAWPEVYFSGIGWVAFEPTPGRGNPDASAYTGVAPEQAGPDGAAQVLDATTTTTTTTTTTVAPDGAAPVPTTDALPPRPAATAAATDSSSSPILKVLLLALGVIAGLAGITAAAVEIRRNVVRRRRRRSRDPARPPADRVQSSWNHALASLRRVDVTAHPAETPREFARRAARLVDVAELRDLGDRESNRRYRATPPGGADAERAEAVSDLVDEAVRSRLDRTGRWRADLDV